jgi:hypothetical protein
MLSTQQRPWSITKIEFAEGELPTAPSGEPKQAIPPAARAAAGLNDGVIGVGAAIYELLLNNLELWTSL